MYGMLIEEVARGASRRALVRYSRSGVPSPQTATTTGARIQLRPRLGVDPFHRSAPVLRFGSEAEPLRRGSCASRVPRLTRRTGSRSSMTQRMRNWPRPPRCSAQHEHVTDPREPAPVGDDAREPDLLRRSGRGATCTDATTRDHVLEHGARAATPPVRLLHEEPEHHVEVDGRGIGRDGVVALSPPVDRVGA